jgi:hypothetical protein
MRITEGPTAAVCVSIARTPKVTLPRLSEVRRSDRLIRMR